MTFKVVGICWLIFVGYWLVSAFKTKRNVWRQNLSEAFVYRLVTAIGMVMVFGSFYHKGRPEPTSIHAISDALCILGLLLAIWSRRVIAGNWSGDVVFKENHELVQSGPYHYVRHPIYSGLLLMVLGTALCHLRLIGLIGFVITSVGFWIKLKREETLMVENFGQTYVDYKSNVKALVPFVL